mmetsp:Transcript_284/g.690  ORF Transcript_284/g.690 Transcript_284/m.690 type:complete len:192 (-) Transcript_284:947-1522(-)
MSGFAYSGVSNSEGGDSGSGNGAMAIASRFMPTAEGLKDSVLGAFSKAQPWGEFANTKQFNIPQASEVPDRLKENIPHYAFNYVIIFLVLSVFVVLTKPLSLVSVALVILGYYRLFVMAGEDPVKVGPLELDTNMKKGAVLSVGGVLLFWMTGAITGIMSLIGTVGLLGGVHALARKPASEPDFESGLTQG